MEDYFVTNRAYPTGITGAYQDICPPSGGSGCIDLSVLVPDYLAIIPISPNAATGTTGYTVAINPSNGQISLSAPDSELGVTTAINDLTPLITFAKRVGSTGSDEGTSIDYLNDGSIISTGSFEGTVIFGEGEASETNLTAVGSMDVFIAKYNADGSLVWAKSAGGVLSDGGKK